MVDAAKKNDKLEELYNHVKPFYDNHIKSQPKETTSNNSLRDDIYKALKETTLGREGLVAIEMMRSEGQEELRRMEKEGLVKKLPVMGSWVSGTPYGLVGERYPKTLKDLLEYRQSGSTKMYSEYNQSKKKNHEKRI